MASTPIVVPSGKSVSYQPLVPGDKEGSCYLCGAYGTGTAKKKVIKATFTDQSWAKSPTSDMVCDYCTWALSYKFDTRLYSFYGTESSLEALSRQRIREVLLQGPSAAPYIMIIAVSGQKWLHFKAQVGMSLSDWVLMFEERKMRFRPQEFSTLLEPVERLYQTFTKDEIASGEYQSHKMIAHGIDKWEADEELVSPHRGSRLLELVLFVAQKGETG
ncbi:hypothetical protein [Alicyclobacillus suci]|uniref:hypothetical protein n=1 Tax=Alicyclobacillus suci TaxID=2816080 RepID=UPI001A8D48DA|nr:hypothetical protein [Alicyclobacillus suci]